MSSSSFTRASILRGNPTNVAKIANLRPDAREDHQHPFIHGVDEHHRFTFLVFFNRFSHPSSRAFLLALMEDRSERRIYIVG